MWGPAGGRDSGQGDGNGGPEEMGAKPSPREPEPPGHEATETG